MTPISGGSKVTYKPATQKDLIEYFNGRPPFSCKAIIFELDGVPSGIGGYKIERGNFVVFSQIKENVTVDKVTVWRCAKIVMNMIKDAGIPMYAVAENKRFVEKLGFKNIQDEVYQWLS